MAPCHVPIWASANFKPSEQGLVDKGQCAHEGAMRGVAWGRGEARGSPFCVRPGSLRVWAWRPLPQAPGEESKLPTCSEGSRTLSTPALSSPVPAAPGQLLAV